MADPGPPLTSASLAMRSLSAGSMVTLFRSTAIGSGYQDPCRLAGRAALPERSSLLLCDASRKRCRSADLE
eukprot:scaffold21228_cov140-Isochrysis_galbana.AAC.1